MPGIELAAYLPGPGKDETPWCLIPRDFIQQIWEFNQIGHI